MNKKYEVHNQITGLNDEAATFKEAKELQEKNLNEYFNIIKNNLFCITVLVEQENGSWEQSLADDKGNPISKLEIPNNAIIQE